MELQNSFDKALEKAQAAMERLTAKVQGNLSVKSVSQVKRQSRILSALEGPSQERLVNNPAPGSRIIESSHSQPIQAPNFPSAFCRIPNVKIEPFC